MGYHITTTTTTAAQICKIISDVTDADINE